MIPNFAGKEVYTSNFSPEDLQLIIDFIETNLDEPLLDRPKVQKSRFKGLSGINGGSQGLSPENRLQAP